MSEFKLLIDGTERAGSTPIWEGVTDPATGEVVGRVAYATNEDLDRGVEATERGLSAWGAVTPLCAYLFTNDAGRQRRLTDAMRFGTVGVNDVPTHLPEGPLGGWKAGYGTQGGHHILAP